MIIFSEPKKERQKKDNRLKTPFFSCKILEYSKWVSRLMNDNFK